MSTAGRLSQRIQAIMDLSILLRVNMLYGLSGRRLSRLQRFLRPVVSGARREIGLLASSYQVMRERLRDSLQEIEQKTRQLEESRDQLVKSRDSLQSIIDSLDDELMVLDSRLRITQANQKLRLNHKGEEIIGRYCYEVTHQLNHPCHPPSCVCPVSSVWHTGKAVRVVHVHPANQDGSTTERYIEMSASPIRDSKGEIIQVVELSRDVTESRELEQNILEANSRLLALNEIASTVSQSLSLDVIINSALDKALGLIKSQIGCILLIDEKSQTLSCRVHHGLSDRFVQGIANLAPEESIAGRAAEQGKVVVVEDTSQDHRVTPLVVSEEGLKAFVSVPMKSRERIVGVLNIASREPRRFSQQEVELLTAMGYQLGIAIENAELYEELQLKEKIRAELLRQVISAQEDERRRVARELHDVTSQALATLAVRLESLTLPEGSSRKDRGALIKEIKSLLGATSREVHELIYNLRTSMLDDLGLPAALRSLVHHSLDAAGVEVYFEVIGQEKRLSPQLEITLYRIVQEAITNIASHAQAQSTYVSLEFKSKEVVVQVEDDGIGFDLTQVFSPTGNKESIGLLGMKERAELLGGTLTIDTKTDSGTILTVKIPTEE